MKLRNFSLTVAMVSGAVASYGQTQPANHLVLSEIGVAVPGSGEFTEIYNPTGAAVDLTNYYISDHNLYFDLPSVVSAQITNTLTGTSDHLLQLPAGMSIPSGGTVVICHQATNFLNVYFDGDLSKFTSLPGSPQLAEVIDTNPAVPNIATNYNRASPEYPLDRGGITPSAGGNNLNHTDGDESTVLFFWDGQGPLIKDLDMVHWRAQGNAWGSSSNQLSNKSGVLEQGPNGIAASYGFDFGVTDNLTARFPETSPGEVGSGNLIRHSLLEIGETHVGGNGLFGDDESLEQVAFSWKMLFGSPSNGSPGITDLSLSANNQAPIVGIARRNIQFPAPGTTVRITAPVYDDGTVTARLMVDKGTGTFTATTMTSEGGNLYGADISTAGLAEGTHIKFYVTATDNNGLVARETDQTYLRAAWPGFHEFMVKSTPYLPTDLMVTEVMYNPKGGNNYAHSQYLEIHNPGTTPLDIGSFAIVTPYVDREIVEPATDTTPAVYENLPPTSIRIPPGTVIPPKGYAVIAGQKALLLTSYPGMDPSRVVNVDIEPSLSFMPHVGTIFYFFGPNDFDYNDSPVDNAAAFKSFEYKNNVDGWPQGGTAAALPLGTSAGDKGYSIELTTLTPGADSVATNWAVSKFYNGSPMAENSVDTTLRPGDVTVATPSRSIASPTSTDQITISALVSSTTPIDNVKTLISINGLGYTEVPMTSGDGTNYSALIGQFPDNSLIKYYVVATDTSGNKGTFPLIAPHAVVPFRVENTSPVANIVINEIMFNPSGTDNKNYPEYIELYNTGSTPIDMSYYQYGTSLKIGDNSVRLMPEGTILPANGYLVMAGRLSHFANNYISDFVSTARLQFGEIDINQVLSNSWDWGGSVLTNGNGATIRLVHPNSVDYYDITDGTPFLALNYQNSGTWPGAGGDKSIELIEPSFDPTGGPNWAFSIPRNGTPMNRNSVSPPLAQVSDWTLY